jgi:hypothetical protein
MLQMLVVALVALLACCAFVYWWRTGLSKSAPWKGVDVAFIQRGMSYYVAGRFCAVAHEFPACANLLHHALEMFLKGDLCRRHSKEELRRIGHNLWRAWTAFKLDHADQRLESHDKVERELTKFERIRYPDEGGMIGTFDLFSEHESTFTSRLPKTPPRYKLNLEDINRIVLLFFKVAKVNPDFFLNSTSEAARDALNNQNRHALHAV